MSRTYAWTRSEKPPIQGVARRWIVIVAWGLVAPSVFAADYYVDQARGNDSFDGTSLDQPFATVGKAAAVADAGDAVHVRKGVYRETVRPTRSGHAGAPIVFQPYAGEQVVISGADVIGGWSRAGEGLYQAELPADFFASSINQSLQVFVDGRMVHLARWPDLGPDLSRPNKATITKFISKTRDESRNMTVAVFEDDRIPEGADFTGAEIYLQPNREGWGWTLSGVVVSHEGKRLTIETRNGNGADGVSDKYHEGARYYLFNQRNLLDSPGEWFHDREANTLHLRLPDDGSPEGHIVEAKKRDYGFDLTDRSHVTVKDLHLFACSLTTDNTAGGDSIGYDADGKERYPWRPAEWVAPARHIVVDGVDAKYLNHYTDVSGHFFLQRPPNTGIVMAGEDHVIRNCRIRYGAGNGISLQGRRHRCVNNQILDTNYMSTDCAAISTGTNTVSEDFEIAYNTIRNAARSGMTIRRLQNSDPQKLVTRIHHNDVSEYGLQDWDVGAFYTFGQDGRFVRIDHNHFHCSHDNAVGMFHGAYWDFSKNYVLDHNVIWGVAKPIQVTHDFDHETAKINNLLIYNNTAITNDAAWGRPFDQSVGNGSVIRNNIFKVCLFQQPDGGWVNHWPNYGSGDVTAGNNLVYGDSESAYWSKEQKFHQADLHAEEAGFMDAAEHDYRLKPDSPASETGVRFGSHTRDGITVPPYHDIEGEHLSIGAFEDGQSPWRVGADLSRQME